MVRRLCLDSIWCLSFHSSWILDDEGSPRSLQGWWTLKWFSLWFVTCHIILRETGLSSINIWGQKALRSVFCKLLFPQMKFNNKKKYEHHHLSQSFLWSCWKRKFFGSKSISQLLKYLAPSFLEIRSTQKRMNKIWICFTFQISTLNNQEPVL